MREQPKREPLSTVPDAPKAPALPMTSDIPEEWRAGRFVTLTVGGGVDLSETHPTDANPEARG